MAKKKKKEKVDVLKSLKERQEQLKNEINELVDFAKKIKAKGEEVNNEIKGKVGALNELVKIINDSEKKPKKEDK